MFESAPTQARRILVLANETLAGAALHETVKVSAGLDGRVLVVAPALNSRLRHWLSDSDAATARAEQRLTGCLAALESAGIEAEGTIGDADPLQAALDALAVFAADEIVVATHPEGKSNWLAHGLVDRLCERASLPVLHVVVGASAPAKRRSRSLAAAA